MATENLSPALRTPSFSRPHPKARPGYGKRTAGVQAPSRNDDFVLLPERERHIAGFIDRLPDGAAMDIKSLAKVLPLYGQMAVGTALRALAVAGHLRHARCPGGEGDQVRWVTLTFWSRTPRDNEWWGAFLSAENDRAALPAPLPAEVTAPPVAAVAPDAAPVVAPPRPTPVQSPQPDPDRPSPAYLALARLGRADPRLALSAADCVVLEELARAWLDRGVSADYLIHALSSGLPTQVDSPVGFVRRRLRDKLPPVLATAPVAPTAPGAPLMIECTNCRAPGRSEALPDGLCRACRTPDRPVPTQPAPVIERDIHAHVGRLRELLKTP